MSKTEQEEFEERVVGGSEGSPVVKIPKTELVAVDRLKVDGKNPNKMGSEKFEALKKNIEKYGFLIPVITNKDYLVADGEHRLKAAKELFFEEVPVIALQVEEVDRRILRQILNKLRGEHDSELDQEEFKFLLKENSLELLSELSDISLDYLEEIAKEEFKEIKQKEVSFLKTEKKCPKCGYEW